VLTGNVRINFGVIWHFVLSFSYLDNRKLRNLTLRLTPIMSAVHVDD